MMELHTCRNCQIINQVVGEQTQRFSILSEENLVLHNMLIKTRQSLQESREQLYHVKQALVAEREQNLQTFLKKRVLYKEVNAGYDNEHINQHERKKESGEVIGSSESTFLETIRELQENQQAAVDIMYNESACHFTLLKEHINQAEEHASLVLELCLRNDLFAQKKQNIIDREEFLKTVDTLTVANATYIQEVKRSVISATTKTADKLTKGAINSLCSQLNERDKLVAMLRKQQTLLQGQIDQLQKREESLHNDHKVVLRKLKSRMEYEQNKQTDLERQRRFDAEGFRNDIKSIRQNVKLLNGKLLKLPPRSELLSECNALIKDVDKVDNNVENFYYTRINKNV